MNGEETYNDLYGHGTAVASIIASQYNNKDLLGISPNVSLYAVKVLDQHGNGYFSDVISAIEWSIDNDIDWCIVKVPTLRLTAIVTFEDLQFEKLLKL